MYSIGGFEWISINLSKRAGFSLPDIRKQPQTSLESITKANYGSAIHGH